MTQKDSLEDNGSTDQNDNKSVQFTTVEDKAREALKHDHLEKNCAVTVRVHNRDHDSDRNVTDHLIQTSDEWISFSTWTEAGGGTGITVKDYGETLQIEVVDLDQDVIDDRICSEALDVIDVHEEIEQPVQPFTALVRNVEAVADDLVDRWQNTAEHVVSERINEGIAGWNGHIAWDAHGDNAIVLEADRTTSWFVDEHVTADVSDDVEATIHDILVQSLYDAIADYRGRRTPHLDYTAEVTLRD